MIVPYLHFILGHIQCNNINLNSSRTNLQAPSTFLFKILFNNICLVGFTASLSIYSSFKITIAQWFYFFVLFNFYVAHLFSVVASFFFITGIEMTSPFTQTANTSQSSSKYLLKTLIHFPKSLVSTFGEPR